MGMDGRLQEVEKGIAAASLDSIASRGEENAQALNLQEDRLQTAIRSIGDLHIRFECVENGLKEATNAIAAGGVDRIADSSRERVPNFEQEDATMHNTIQHLCQLQERFGALEEHVT